ncbi:MAG: hypothetical protein ACHBN1_03380 [Heteroscytonema crispum UTEX LB 1556]
MSVYSGISQNIHYLETVHLILTHSIRILRTHLYIFFIYRPVAMCDRLNG